MRRFFGVAGMALLLTACSPAKGFGTSVEVAADEYGNRWPLTAESALLGCEYGVVLLTIKGNAHGIGTVDELLDLPPRLLRPEARDAANSPDARKQFAALVEDGHALCE